MSVPSLSTRRIILIESIGGDSSVDETRQSNPYLVSNGWQGLVEGRLLPVCRRWNIRRVMLDRMYGQVDSTHPGNPIMEFDAYIQALSGNCWYDSDGIAIDTQDLSVLTDGFADAMATLYEEVDEVICRVGSPKFFRTDLQHNPSAGFTGGEWDTWLPLAMACVQPFVDAGCSIGFDNTGWSWWPNRTYQYQRAPAAAIPWCGEREEEFSARLIRHLEGLGVRMYLEPWGQLNDYIDTGLDGHLDDVPRLLTDSYYDTTIPDNLSRWKSAAAFRPLCGEIIRWHRFVGYAATDAEVQECLAVGDTFATKRTFFTDSNFSDAIKTEYQDEQTIRLSGTIDLEITLSGEAY